MSSNKQVAEFGNGNVRTVVLDVGGGEHHWVRSPGRLRESPLWSAPEPVLRALRQAGTAELAVATPEPSGTGQRYRLPGGRSVAFTILLGLSSVTEHVPLLEETGRVVRRIHDIAPVRGFDSAPPPLVELGRWLADGSGPRDAAALHLLIAERLGPGRWELVRRWCAELVDVVQNRTLLHGTVGLGQVVPGAGGDRLMAGTHIGIGSPAWDVGALLGQVLELVEARRRSFTGQPPEGDHPALARAFLRGYGPVDDPALVGRAAALSCLNHVRVFASYGTWHEDVVRHADLVADLVEGEGALALDLAGAR